MSQNDMDGLRAELSRQRGINLKLLRKLASARKEALLFTASLCDDFADETCAQMADNLRLMAGE